MCYIYHIIFTSEPSMLMKEIILESVYMYYNVVLNFEVDCIMVLIILVV